MIDTLDTTRWKQLEDQLEKQFNKVPDMEAILFLIGINEFRGHIPKIKFSKEQKQELMHVAVCTLLATKGYYQLDHYDDEGWPHFTELKPISENSLEDQETLLKQCILNYMDIY